MALLFMDSFDHYATADLGDKWSSTGIFGASGTLTITTVNGRRSGPGLRWLTGTASQVQGFVSRVLSPADATVIMGFALNVSVSSLAASGTFVASVRDSGGNVQLALRLNQDMTLSVCRGQSGGTVLGTTSAAVATGAFTYVEFRAVIADAGGTVDVRFGGASVLSLAGLDTKNTAVAGWASVALGQSEQVSSSNQSTLSRSFDFDDLYVLDGSGAAPWNAFLGDVRVDARLPTAPGATTGWTPLAGANWDAVNDAAPDDDTTYTSTSTLNATDTFVTQDAAVVGATIYGVQHCLNMKKMDAGVCTVAPVIRHAGVDYPGAAIAPGTTYAYGLAIAQTNPGTSAAWVEADFNAAEFGYKRTA